MKSKIIKDHLHTILRNMNLTLSMFDVFVSEWLLLYSIYRLPALLLGLSKYQ